MNDDNTPVIRNRAELNNWRANLFHAQEDEGRHIFFHRRTHVPKKPSLSGESVLCQFNNALQEGNLQAITRLTQEQNATISKNSDSPFFFGRILNLGSSGLPLTYEKIATWLWKDHNIDFKKQYFNLVDWACQEGNLDMIQYVLENIDPDFRFGHGEIFLRSAIQHRHFPVVQYFLREGLVDVNSRHPLILDLPCEMEDLDMLYCLLETPSVIKTGGKGNTRPNMVNIHIMENDMLEIACMKGNIDILQCLVDTYGADIYQHIWKCLYHTVNKGHFMMFRYLIERFNVTSDHCTELLNLACSHGSLEMVKYLAEALGIVDIHRNDEEALICACKRGNVEIVKYLVEGLGANGADIHARNGKPLYVAVENMCFDVIRYLVLRGA